MVQPAITLVPLDALLMEVIEEQQLAAKAKEISIDLQIIDPKNPALEDSFTLLGDWDYLARLFTNLIANAIAYTAKSGPIAVELQRLGSINHEYLQVKVKDRGIGIPQEAIPHLFDRFYRVDPARKRSESSTQTPEDPSLQREKTGGSGLGLAIAAAIVKSYQGQIHIDSQLHQGTTVTITLPIQ
jgi:two-component system, OmpR family, manganese sensing sensor histidine kinase